MRMRIDLLELVQKAIGKTPTIPATIDVREVFDFMDAKGEVDLDIHNLLRWQNAIGLVFTLADVQSLRPHLSDEQAWQVLQRFEDDAEDCLDQIHETLSQLADRQFPAKRKARPDYLSRIISGYQPNGDERANLVALLTDAYHWCQEFGEPLEKFLTTARSHFDEERKKPETRGT